MITILSLISLFVLLTQRPAAAVHVHQRDTQSRGFHYHYEVISPSAVSSGPQSLTESEPVVEPLRTEESRATFGYRKPSGEYRVVDYLADGLGFNRKGVHSESGRTVRAQEQRQTTATSTTSTTTTTRPTPIYVPSTTPATDYDDEEEEDREGQSIPPPAPLRMGKTSPAQQARLMHQEQSNGQTGKSEEQRKERSEDMRSSGVKGNSKKAKDNEIRQEKMDRSEPTTVRSPPPPPTTTTTTTTTSSTTTEPSSALERETETVMTRSSTGRIKGRLMDTNDGTTTANEAEMEQPEKMMMRMEREREQPQSKISIHQLISQAMPTLQMSVVPVYFMNKATRTVMAVPYLVMKSVSKMPLIPGMVDGLSPSPMSGAQNLLSFAMNNKIMRSDSASRSHVPAMLALSPSLAEKSSPASLARELDSQTLEAGVEDARPEDSTGTETPTAGLSASSSHPDNNWVTIDSPSSAETLDNTWFKR